MTIQQNYPNIRPSMSIDFANTKQLDPRITYSRASTGTYYDGKTVAKAEENLLTFSEQFDNAAWTKSAASVTANTEVAPDGTTTADTLTSDGASTQHNVSAAPTLAANSTYAFSVYAKAGATNFLQITTNLTAGSANHYANFNLQTGVVSAVGSSATASITAVGNGWYRCTAVMNTVLTSASATFILIPVDSGTSTRNPTFATVTSVQLWGAQLEQRSFATAYTPTTTAPITNYIPVLQTASAGTPRFDHNPITGESLGLLIEEQRTNLLLRSEEFNDAYWGKANVTVTANTIVSPDGTLNADKLVEDTATAIHRLQLSSVISVVAGTAYTVSIYAKASGRQFINLNFSTAFAARATFDLVAGVVANIASGTATIVSVGNGWYRCSVTGTAAATATTSAFVQINNSGTALDTSYTGDGYSGIYIWGAQLEAGAFATSYIPTAASQVTRAADSASMTGTNFSSWYNQSEGSFFASMDYMSATTTSWVLAAHSGVVATTNDYLAFVKSSGAAHRQSIVASGASQGNLDVSGAASGVVYKYAGCYKTNDAAFTVGGITPLTDNTVTLLVPNALQLGNLFNQYLNGHISRIAYYPRRLTNTQLQSLTT